MDNKLVKFVIVLLLTVSIVAPAVIMLLFNMAMNGSYFSFGLLPKESSAWSNFGSLLSGAFTMLGSVASLATIAYVYKQNKDALEHARAQQRRTEIQAKMQQVKTARQAHQQIEQANQQLAEAKAFNAAQQHFIQQQVERMKFDSYIAHKAYFNIILNDLEADFKGMKFLKRNELYKKVFPINSPFEFSTKANFQDNEGYKFNFEIVDALDKIFSRISSGDYKYPDNSILFYFQYLWQKLSVKPREQVLCGDVFSEFGLYCINIYHLNDDLEMLTKIVNSLLIFSGQNEKEQYNYGAASGALKGALLYFTTQSSHYKVHDKNIKFDALILLSFEISCLPEKTQSMLVSTRRTLMNCTDHSDSLAKSIIPASNILLTEEINRNFAHEFDIALPQIPSTQEREFLHGIKKGIEALRTL